MTNLTFITDILEKVILLLLLALSVWSVSIIIDRRRLFKIEFNHDEIFKFKNEFLNLNSYKQLSSYLNEKYFTHRAILKSLNSAKDELSFEKNLAAQLKSEKLKLEKGLTVLATLGANAPFIGLFGTVLGIIRSFAYLGSQSGSAAVMSGVSQALYATAVGLLVAIPAVIANNYFNFQIRSGLQNAEILRDHILAHQLWKKE